MLRISLLLFVLLVSAASSAQAQVTIPNTFSDGTPALASEVNANFQALASAVNASDCATAADVVCNSSCPACPSCPAAPACDTLGSFNEGVASVDITTDNAAAEAVAAAAAGSAACTQAGGTWDSETSTCTAPYNCFIGGYCAQAAIDFPPANFGYTNVYDGHTQTTEPALGAGCNVSPMSFIWGDGVSEGALRAGEIPGRALGTLCQ